MILEQPPGQGHLVSGLDESSAEVLPAQLLTLVQDIEGRCEKLRPQLLSGRQMLHLTAITELSLLDLPLLLLTFI
jgi:hypothetical protein